MNLNSTKSFFVIIGVLVGIIVMMVPLVLAKSDAIDYQARQRIAVVESTLQIEFTNFRSELANIRTELQEIKKLLRER